MESLTLQRVLTDDQGTLGILSHGNDHVCLTLELPDRDNAPNMSRILAGEYIVEYVKQSASGKYSDCYHVTCVPGRSGILFHPGNWAGDSTRGHITNSLGCILPGCTLTHWRGQRSVSNSRRALQKIHAVTSRKTFKLEVVDYVEEFII